MYLENSEVVKARIQIESALCAARLEVLEMRQLCRRRKDMVSRVWRREARNRVYRYQRRLQSLQQRYCLHLGGRKITTQSGQKAVSCHACGLGLGETESYNHHTVF